MPRKRQWIEAACDNCATLFEKKPSAIKRTKHNFCSRACYIHYQQMHPELVYRWAGGPQSTMCMNCGASILKRPGHKAKPFCSPECHNEYQRKHPRAGHKHHMYKRWIIQCEECGKLVEKWPSHVKKYKHHFCSNECRHEWLRESAMSAGENNPAWRGGYDPYYGPNWSRQRKKARQRDNYKCRICQLKEQDHYTELHVHHIIPMRDFNGNWKAANALTNLITLCQSCHLRVEHGSAICPSNP